MLRKIREQKQKVCETIDVSMEMSPRCSIDQKWLQNLALFTAD